MRKLTTAATTAAAGTSVWFQTRLAARQARGLSFIEYAILAAIILGVAAAFRTTFSTALGNLWERVTNELKNNNS